MQAFKSEEQSQLPLVEREEMEDEEDVYEMVDTLTNHGINAGDVKKLQDAGIYSCNRLIMLTKEYLTGITGLSEAKVDKICEAAEKIVRPARVGRPSWLGRPAPVGRPLPLRMSEWLRKLRETRRLPFFTSSRHQIERPLGLEEFQDGTTRLPLSDPNSFITLAVTAIPACFTSLTGRLSGPDVAELKERMQAYTAQKSYQFVPHGIFLGSTVPSGSEGNIQVFNNTLRAYENTTVVMEVIDFLTHYLNKEPATLRRVHRTWPDLLRWREIYYNRPITRDEVVDQFDLILYEYLIHGVTMNTDIGDYVDMVYLAHEQLSIDYLLSARGVLGAAMDYNAFNAGGDMNIVKGVKPRHLYWIFDQETNNPRITGVNHPRLTGMRFICVPGGGAAGAGAGHCYLDSLKFRFDPTTIRPITTPAPAINWGCNYETKPDPTGNCHTRYCSEHQCVLVLSVRDRLDLDY